MKTFIRNQIVAPLFEQMVVKLIKRNNLTVIAVAGSVGKTTTKTAIASVLGVKHRVLAHQGNYNSQLGMPLSIFELEAPDNILNAFGWLKLYLDARRIAADHYPYEVVVLELGTDHPGEIAAFAYLKPQIGIITAIAPEHMENFTDLEAVADEEFELARYAKKIVLNDSFDQLKIRASGLSNVSWYGSQSNSFSSTKSYPNHIRQALSAAIVVATELGLTESQIKTGLAIFTPAPGRMVRLEGVKGCSLIDDTYNSSPIAIKAALETLSESKGRQIAVLGQMNELGEQSAAYHREVGSECAKLDLLVTLVGDANQFLGPAAVEAGLDTSKWKAFDSPYSAGKWLRSKIELGDTILIKGSQTGVCAEEVTKLLLANPADAKRLVRQSPTWLKRKASQFEVQ